MNASYRVTLEFPPEFRDICVISTKEEKCMLLWQINEIAMDKTKLNHQKSVILAICKPSLRKHTSAQFNYLRQTRDVPQFAQTRNCHTAFLDVTLICAGCKIKDAFKMLFSFKTFYITISNQCEQNMKYRYWMFTSVAGKYKKMEQVKHTYLGS